MAELTTAQRVASAPRPRRFAPGALQRSSALDVKRQGRTTVTVTNDGISKTYQTTETGEVVTSTDPQVTEQHKAVVQQQLAQRTQPNSSLQPTITPSGVSIGVGTQSFITPSMNVRPGNIGIVGVPFVAPEMPRTSKGPQLNIVSIRNLAGENGIVDTQSPILNNAAPYPEFTKRINRAVGFSTEPGVRTLKQQKVGALLGTGVAAISGIPFVAGLAKSALTTVAIVEGTKATQLLRVPKGELGKYVAPISNTENIILNPQFTGAMRTARAEELRSVGSTKTTFGIEFNPIAFTQRLPVVPLFYRPGEKAFKTSIEAQGYEPELATDFSRAGMVGEAAAIFTANVQSELLGTKRVAASFKDVVGQTYKGGKIATTLIAAGKVGVAIAPAGAVEGTNIVLATSLGRFGDPTGRELAKGFAYGGLSAGVVGGLIGGTAATFPKTSKTILGAAYVSDPFEYPGDITAAAIQSGSRIPVVTPTIVLTTTPPAKTPTLSFSTVTAKPRTPTFFPTRTPTRSSVLLPVKVPTTSNILTGIFTPTRSPVSTPTRTPTPVDVPIGIPISTPTSVPVGVPINVPATSPVGVPTSVGVPTTITTPVTVVVPNLMLPPLPPIMGGGGGFFKGLGKLGRRQFKYQPSLVASALKIRGKRPKTLTGFNIRPLAPLKKGKKKELISIRRMI